MPLSIYVWLGSSTSLPQLNALTISGLFLNSFAMGHIIGPLIVNYFFPNNDESIVPAFNLVVLVINYFFFLILVKVIRKTSFKTQISILSGALNGIFEIMSLNLTIVERSLQNFNDNGSLYIL